MLSIYSFLLYTVVHFFWLFGNFQNVFSLEQNWPTHYWVGWNFKDMSLKLRRNSMLDSYRGPCLLNLMILPNCDKRGLCHLFQASQCMCCCTKPQGWHSGRHKSSGIRSLYKQPHIHTPTSSLRRLSVYETPPSKLGERVGLYSHAPKFKVCVSHCLLVDIGAGKGMYSQWNEGY